MGRKENKYKILAKDTVLFAISNFGSKIILFLLVPLYTSVLATEEYGIADLITTTVEFIYPILTLAIADATLRYALDKSASSEAVLANSLLLTGLSIGALALLLPLLKLINSALEEYWIYFILFYAFYNISNCFSNFIKGIEKTKLFAIQGIVHTITFVLCNIVLLLIFDLGLIGYLISLIAGYFVPCVIMFFCGKIYKFLFPLKIDGLLLADMLKYSIPMIPTVLAWTVNSSIDKYMIISMFGLGESGIYSVAHKIPTVFTSILTVFTNAWQISAISNRGSHDESEYYTKIYRGLNIIGIYGCLAIMLCSKWLAKILFAKDYFEAWKYVPFLVIASLFSSLSAFLAAAFRADKKTKSLFVSVAAGAGVNIILNVILLHIMGTIGAAVATAVSFFFVWFLRMIMVQKIVRVKIGLWQTICTYILFGCAGVLMTLEFHFAKLFVIFFAVVIFIINIKIIMEILKGVIGYIVKIVHKK